MGGNEAATEPRCCLPSTERAENGRVVCRVTYLPRMGLYRSLAGGVPEPLAALRPDELLVRVRDVVAVIASMRHGFLRVGVGGAARAAVGSGFRRLVAATLPGSAAREIPEKTMRLVSRGRRCCCAFE